MIQGNVKNRLGAQTMQVLGHGTPTTETHLQHQMETRSTKSEGRMDNKKLNISNTHSERAWVETSHLVSNNTSLRLKDDEWKEVKLGWVTNGRQMVQLISLNMSYQYILQTLAMHAKRHLL